MRQQRRAIGPLLDENQPQRILAIDMHGVRNASGLLAGAMDMLEAQFANLAEGIFPGRHAAGHYDHRVPPLSLSLIVMELNRRRWQNRSVAAASVLARHVRPRSAHRCRARRGRTSHRHYAAGFSGRLASWA